MENDKVAIYCRLSVEDIDKMKTGDDSESIQNQKRLLVDYALEQGWSVYKIYSDDDYSGLDRARPAFEKMIQEGKAGNFNIVLCKHQSRFTRDMELVEKYIHGLFVLWGIRFVSIIDHVDTNVKGNKKSRQINALINEWYVEDLSENIRAVFRKKMKDGQFLGSFAPYGYGKDPKDRHKLIVDPGAAAIVKKIYDWYLQGKGIAVIANRLTESGIPTPTQYKIQQGFAYANGNAVEYSQTYGVWAVNTVRRILTNKTYIGQLIQGRERKVSYKSKKIITVPEAEWIVIEKNHMPIIDEKIFYTVQNLIASKRKIHHSKVGGKSNSILSGKVKCLDCGHTMEKGGPTRDGKACYLRCAFSHKTKSKGCTSHSIRLDALIGAIETKIQALIYNYMCVAENREELEKIILQEANLKDQSTETKKEIKILEEKILELYHILAVAYADKVRGNISEMDYISFKTVFDADIEKQQRRQKALHEQMESAEIHCQSLEEVGEWIQKQALLQPITHEIINTLIDCIYIGEKKNKVEQEVIIYWMW